MSKKQKRQVSRSEVRPATTLTTTAPTTAPATRSSRMPVVAEFNPDYTYVIKDLKRIGILAGVFITILVILTFFLR